MLAVDRHVSEAVPTDQELPELVPRCGSDQGPREFVKLRAWFLCD